MVSEQTKDEQGHDSAKGARRSRPLARSRRRQLSIGLGALLGCLLLGTCALRYLRAGRGLTEGRLQHGDRLRTYFVHLPPGHRAARPVPLVLALHGGGGSARGFDATLGAGLLAEGDRRGWVVALPDGIAHGWNDGRPPSTSRSAERIGVDDVGFIAALISELHARYGIDEERVYATGISNGGFMCQRLAVELSDQIAAVASVTAALPKALEGERPRGPVSVMLINGTADPLVPYAGGQVLVFGGEHGEVLSTDATFEWWQRHNGCTAQPTERALPDRAPDDGTTVTVREVDGCPGASKVHRYRIEGGGHTWPGGRGYLPESVVGRVSQDIDATSAIFEFFDQ